MTVTLRPYQSVCVDQTREAYRAGFRRPLLVSPTGSGKTVIFAYVCSEAIRRGKRVMILAHRAELLDQISEALTRSDVKHGFIAAGYPAYRGETAVIASVQTLARRLDKAPLVDLIILDEAHHAILRNTWGKVLAHWPDARVLGVTATPRRMGGEALGDIFDTMILGPDVADLTAAGYLVPARIFAPPTISTEGLHVRAGDYIQAEVAAVMDKPHVVGDAIAHYRKHADGKQAVCFCYSVEHSKFMARAFIEAGYSAAHLDGSLDRDLRRSMIADFRTGAISILCSVDVIGEGLDIPGIECGILLRPTASLVVAMQQIGRLLRPAPGKREAIILDHARITETHGFPDEERDWTLAGRDVRKRKASDKPLPVRVCPSCFAAQRPAPVCKICNEPFPVQAREVAEVEGELQEIDPVKLAARREKGKARTLEQLLEIEKQRAYRSGWATHVFNARQRMRQTA